MNKRILVVNGPNLNLLGTREPEKYGTATLDDAIALCEAAASESGFEVRAVQSNHEGVLLDVIHQAGADCDAVVINAGALTHTSVALRDALTGVALPFAEVHITNVHAREPFRHHSYLSDVASAVIVGAGIRGYEYGVRRMIEVVAG